MPHPFNIALQLILATYDLHYLIRLYPCSVLNYLGNPLGGGELRISKKLRRIWDPNIPAPLTSGATAMGLDALGNIYIGTYMRE